MAEVHASAERELPVPPDRALAFLRDYRTRRPRILTDQFSDYRVEEGGEGAGTVYSYHFHAGRRERDYRLRVEEIGGEALRESDELSTFVSTWTVRPAGEGRSRVVLESSWSGASGLAGFFERTFAPLGLKRIYAQMLERMAGELSAGG